MDSVEIQLENRTTGEVTRFTVPRSITRAELARRCIEIYPMAYHNLLIVEDTAEHRDMREAPVIGGPALGLYGALSKDDRYFPSGGRTVIHFGGDQQNYWRSGWFSPIGPDVDAFFNRQEAVGAHGIVVQPEEPEPAASLGHFPDEGTVGHPVEPRRPQVGDRLVAELDHSSQQTRESTYQFFVVRQSTENKVTVSKVPDGKWKEPSGSAGYGITYHGTYHPDWSNPAKSRREIKVKDGRWSVFVPEYGRKWVKLDLFSDHVNYTHGSFYHSMAK